MLLCPVCNIPLCGVEYEGVPVHVCPDCGGALAGDARAEQVRKRRVETWGAAERWRLGSEAAGRDTAGVVRCPRCLMKMRKVAVETGGASFHLDRCRQCALWWFDRGELDLVQAEYERGLDSRTPEDWARVEKAALAHMTLEDHKDTTVKGVDEAPAWMTAGTVWWLVWAVDNLAEGLAEDSPERRREPLVKAAIGLAVVVAVIILWVLVRKVW